MLGITNIVPYFAVIPDMVKVGVEYISLDKNKDFPAKNELIEGYEMFVSPATDIVFVKYPTGESYMIFCID